MSSRAEMEQERIMQAFDWRPAPMGLAPRRMEELS